MYIYTTQLVLKRHSNTFKQIRSNNTLKNNPKPIFGKMSKSITPNTPHFQILAPMLEPFAWLVRPVARLFCDLFFGTSEGTDSSFPWATLGVTFLNLWGEFRSKFTPGAKHSRATNGTKHTFKKSSKDSNYSLRAVPT